MTTRLRIAKAYLEELIGSLEATRITRAKIPQTGGNMTNRSIERRTSRDRLGRRKFIGVTAATAGALFLKPELVRGTAANSAVRVGLLGCGGRGTEDATNLIDTGNARVVALADLFRDQLDAAQANFDELQQAKGYAALDPSQLFLGPNAYRQIAASKEIDAIVIATPPYYHPDHLEAVVASGKHVYLEKAGRCRCSGRAPRYRARQTCRRQTKL